MPIVIISNCSDFCFISFWADIILSTSFNNPSLIMNKTLFLLPFSSNISKTFLQHEYKGVFPYIKFSNKTIMAIFLSCYGWIIFLFINQFW